MYFLRTKWRWRKRLFKREGKLSMEMYTNVDCARSDVDRRSTPICLWEEI